MGLIGGLSAGALLSLCAIMLFLWSVNIHLCACVVSVCLCLFVCKGVRAHTNASFSATRRRQRALELARKEAVKASLHAVPVSAATLIQVRERHRQAGRQAGRLPALLL